METYTTLVPKKKTNAFFAVVAKIHNRMANNGEARKKKGEKSVKETSSKQ